MSVEAAPRSTTTGYRVGQFLAGLIVLLLIVGIAAAAGRLPWGIADPMLRFVGEHPILNAFAKAFIVVNFIAIHVLFLIWWERKFAGWMQARLGPMHVGWKGLAQTAADALK